MSIPTQAVDILFLQIHQITKAYMNNLREILLSEMSRRNIDFVVEIILNNPHLFDELFTMVIQNKEPISRRAIWALDHCTEKEPKLMLSKIEGLIEAFPNFKHDGLKRHSLRVLRNYEIPEEKIIVMIDLCFGLLHSRKESIAVKVHAMDILYTLSKKEPGLKPELAAAIEFQLHDASSGLKNHSEKLLNKICQEKLGDG